MTWTAERKERAKELWEKGLSATQVAAELGGLTRNAVIGLITRAGLCRGTPRKSALKSARRKASGSRRPPQELRDDNRLQQKLARNIFAKPPKLPKAAPPRPVEAPPSLRIAHHDLKPHHCRWPEGDGPFFFCGHDRQDGPYFARHARAAWSRP